jgi:hypothetical protein
VNCGGANVVLAFTGGGVVKTHPTGTWLEDSVVEEFEVSVLELEVADEDVELLEVAVVELLIVECVELDGDA